MIGRAITLAWPLALVVAVLLPLGGCAGIGPALDELWGPEEPCARAAWAARAGDSVEWQRARMACDARGQQPVP